MQDALRVLNEYWTERGCMVVQPFNTEVGAGTMNPATILRVLGPEPWRVAYVEPSVRPDDSRYGENPNRLQTHTQFQVILKPDPGNPQELYLGSLKALGIDIDAHDIRFVEDNWAQPAIGAWGLGWEVWLDGMEITQFTYFQQVGGQNLDPVAVELTYGLERILMAQQGVTHFKDIAYAPGISYGEAFGQTEYEMSRYYLDEADLDTNRGLFEAYTAEAQRMIDARLPVPAHGYVLKSSHAFNVLDSRGAISTTERAKAFSTMRRLARSVCELWVERREELGFPLLKDAASGAGPSTGSGNVVPSDAGPLTGSGNVVPQTVVCEIGVEELPPHVVTETIAAVRSAVTEKLGATRLDHGDVDVQGTPRRIVITIDTVAAGEPDAERLAKGPKVAAAYDADGQPTRALQGFARGQGVDPAEVITAEFGGNDHVAVAVTEQGRSALDILSQVLGEIIGGLRAEKNMRWGDPALSFSRPIRWLVALWGADVVPLQVSALTAGRTTYLQRNDDHAYVDVADADSFAALLADRGIVVDVAERRNQVETSAQQLASEIGGSVDVEAESELINEITNLVEQPHAIRADFESRYLDLPEQILTTVMRKHQRYLPVRDAGGRLLPHVITMANGDCDDAVVKAGNESVLRARYEDAAFFWQADLKVPLAQFRSALSTLTFEDRLGSVADRSTRIEQVALDLADRAGVSSVDRQTLRRAGELAKFDLGTQMVVELSSLAGFMAREYALRAGEPEAVAVALYEMEQPRTSADAVPASVPGALLALADRFDLLMGMFALGAKPTGSSDPFGLRRAALGVVRILRSHGELSMITLSVGLATAAERIRSQGVTVAEDAVDAAREFVVGRFAQQLRDEQVPAELINAVLPGAESPGRLSENIEAVSSLAGDQNFRALVAALQRIERIVPAGTPAGFDPELLTEPAERALITAVAETGTETASDVGTYAGRSVVLVDPVNRFFDDILVMAEDPALRAARLGLLASVRVQAPSDLDWRALDTHLG